MKLSFCVEKPAAENLRHGPTIATNLYSHASQQDGKIWDRDAASVWVLGGLRYVTHTLIGRWRCSVIHSLCVEFLQVSFSACFEVLNEAMRPAQRAQECLLMLPNLTTLWITLSSLIITNFHPTDLYHSFAPSKAALWGNCVEISPKFVNLRSGGARTHARARTYTHTHTHTWRNGCGLRAM